MEVHNVHSSTTPHRFLHLTSTPEPLQGYNPSNYRSKHAHLSFHQNTAVRNNGEAHTLLTIKDFSQPPSSPRKVDTAARCSRVVLWRRHRSEHRFWSGIPKPRRPSFDRVSPISIRLSLSTQQWRTNNCQNNKTLLDRRMSNALVNCFWPGAIRHIVLYYKSAFLKTSTSHFIIGSHVVRLRLSFPFACIACRTYVNCGDVPEMFQTCGAA